MIRARHVHEGDIYEKEIFWGGHLMGDTSWDS